MRYFKRLIYLPHTATETLERLRQLDTVLGDTASKAVAKKMSWPTPSPSAELTPEVPLVQERSPSPTPGEVFAGYSAKDIRVFDLFKNVRPESKPGFVTDFLGTRTRTTSLWNNARQFDGHVFGLPVPHDLFEAIEWIGLLKAVVSAGSSFAMMELRAGWGPWLAAGAVACKHLGIEDVHLLGVEADPGRFELMRQHFIDNGLDPEAHCLLRAAVGTEAGHARWPRISDAANSGGGRPVRDKDGEVNQDDADYIPHAVHDYIDVEIVPLRDLLARRAVWDLIHIDVQGWEADLVAGSVEELGERAKWLVIGTHSRQLDGRLIATLHRAGWVLENEKPTRFTFDRDKGSLELMAEVDGTQIWRNPRFTSLHVGKGERKSVPNSSASIDVSNDPVSLAQEHVENARIFATREDALASLPHGGKFAEIGVAFGDFSEHVLRTLEPTKFDAFDIFRLHEIETIWGRPSVDTFRGQTHRQFYEGRFAQEMASGQMRVFEGDSSQLMSEQPDGLYDIIYIDGDHTLEGVLRDAEVAARKLSRTGYLVFNDYIMADHASNAPYGIVQVVNWFCARLGWRVHYLALQRMMFCDICLVRNL
ncbi:FkbM family methyltransferase [Mesorhizobium sp. B2-4-16]|uniref:class I SAM-dependent methyltransferase n=1 Tax=Mesorhizobium sp. B2-4-16 TaxID=2589933 RepID=UPI0015E401CA|nr:FkbM family methyltransferase [Mesorhizobium sp. B2-4-16]